MTREEKHLWYDFLKTLPQVFKRQKVIGNYIVDFYCPKEKLVIELDGTQHYKADGVNADIKRDEFLRRSGITVLRYSNIDVNHNFEGVCRDILKYLGR